MIIVPEVPCCRYKIERVGTIHRDREVNRICRDSISQSQRTPIKHHNSGTSLIDHSGTMSVALLSTERVSWAITLLMHQMASNICFFFLYFFLTSDFSLRAIKCTFIRIFRLMIPYPHNLLLTGKRNFILFQVRKLRGLLHVHNTQNIMGSN